MSSNWFWHLPSDDELTPVARVCYSTREFVEASNWAAAHFIVGVQLELFFDDWLLSFFLQVLYETIEVLMLTAFGSYVFFGQASNREQENVTGVVIGDVGADIAGILTVTLARRGLGMRVPPLWPRWRRAGVWGWVRAAAQLLLGMVGVAAFFIAADTQTASAAAAYATPAAAARALVGVPSWWVLAVWGWVFVWLVWLAALPAWSAPWRRSVWPSGHWHVGWAALIALVATGALVAPFFRLPYAIITVYWYFGLVVLVGTITSLWVWWPVLTGRRADSKFV